MERIVLNVTCVRVWTYHMKDFHLHLKHNFEPNHKFRFFWYICLHFFLDISSNIHPCFFHPLFRNMYQNGKEEFFTGNVSFKNEMDSFQSKRESCDGWKFVVTWEAVFKNYGAEGNERSWRKWNLTRNKFYKYLKRWFQDPRTQRNPFFEPPVRKIGQIRWK